MAKILLIEDDSDLREVTSDILKEKGYEVIEAVDGRQGVDILVKDKFDVIVSDLRTPTMTALSLINKIGVLSKGARVIIITGHGSEITEQLSKEIKVSAYIEKPFSPEQLLSEVDKALGNS